MLTTEEYDDELYKDLKRGDAILYWNSDANHSWALVVEVHDVRTLSLLPVAPGFDVFSSTPDEREALVVAGGAVVERVSRFNRSSPDRRHTWCGVH